MSDGKILAFYAPYTGAGKSTAAKILDDNESIYFHLRARFIVALKI